MKKIIDEKIYPPGKLGAKYQARNKINKERGADGR